MKAILDTVGFEIESIGLTRNEMSAILDTLPSSVYSMLHLDRDASVEFNARSIGGTSLAVSTHTTEYNRLPITGRSSTYGYELISSPVSISTAENILWNLLPKLQSGGDFTHERAAFHVHVGFGCSIKILKRAMMLGLKVDPLLFRIAGMGRKFRGESNHSIYARPLSNGPSVYHSSSSTYYRMLDPQKAIASSTIREFFNCYAISVDNSSPVRYHPARYFAWNLYSLLLHGTIEFRHFNQTLSPTLAISVVKFCRALAELIMYYDESLLDAIPDMSVFEKYSDDDYIRVLDTLIAHMKMNDVSDPLNAKEIDVMYKNIYDTPHHKLVEHNTLTHNRDYRLSSEYVNSGLFTKVGRPSPAGNIDIHNIGQGRFSIIGDE